MATTISAPSQSDSFVPGWLLATVAALAAFAIVVLLAIALDSDSATTEPGDPRGPGVRPGGRLGRLDRPRHLLPRCPLG